uniref:Uncharacterized protein n=1 Tax=Arion vulgaris TaxID=1028688 RepID=A0A0B6YZ74_9EUPU
MYIALLMLSYVTFCTFPPYKQSSIKLCTSNYVHFPLYIALPTVYITPWYIAPSH